MHARKIRFQSSSGFHKPNPNNPKINLRNTKSNTVSENSIIVYYMIRLIFEKVTDGITTAKYC